MKMDLIEKIENALHDCKELLKDRQSIELTYAELNEIRKLLLLESYREELSLDNLRDGMAFGKQFKNR